jgi:hypothetical protein
MRASPYFQNSAVIERSEATKQSRGRPAALDCFAPLAMTAPISGNTDRTAALVRLQAVASS